MSLEKRVEPNTLILTMKSNLKVNLHLGIFHIFLIVNKSHASQLFCVIAWYSVLLCAINLNSGSETVKTHHITSKDHTIVLGNKFHDYYNHGHGSLLGVGPMWMMQLSEITNLWRAPKKFFIRFIGFSLLKSARLGCLRKKCSLKDFLI